MRSARSVKAWLGIVAVASLLAAGCGDSAEGGGDGDATATSSESAEPTTTTEPTVESQTASSAAEAAAADGFPVTIETPGATANIETRPERIVSISPTATEMLFALGAGSQVVAVDSLSDFPPEAPITDLNAFEPNVEAIIGFEPDLVVLSFDPGDVVAGLEAAGVPAVVQSAANSISDTYTQIEQLGVASGNVGGAAELVGRMQTDLDALSSEAPAPAAALTYYHELDDTLFSVTSQTFIGEIYALAGLQNVADPADEDGSAFGFPQLSAEYLVDADPDLIFLADTKCCGQSADTVAERAGWEGLSAVAEGNVIELDDDVASRWGPRIVDFLEEIIDATSAVGVAAGS